MVSPKPLALTCSIRTWIHDGNNLMFEAEYAHFIFNVYIYHVMPRSRQERLWNLLLTSAFFEIFEQPVIPAAFISLDLFEDLWPLTKISSPRSILGTLGIDSPAISWLYSKAIILIPYLAMVDVDVFPRHIETWQKSETKMGDSMEFQAKWLDYEVLFPESICKGDGKSTLIDTLRSHHAWKNGAFFIIFPHAKHPSTIHMSSRFWKAYSMIHTSPCTNRSNKLKHFP